MLGIPWAILVKQYCRGQEWLLCAANFIDDVVLVLRSVCLHHADYTLPDLV